MKRVAAIMLAIAIAASISAAAPIALEKAARIDMNPTRAIESDGQVVYAGVGAALNIYNIYQRDFPQLVGTIEGHHSNIHKIIVDGTTLYVLWEKEGLEIFDISDCYRPVQLGVFPVFEDPQFERFTDMDLDGSVIYVTGANFLASIDVSEPYSPEQLGYVSLNGAPIKLDYHDGKIFLAAGKLGLGRFFVPNPREMFVSGVQSGVYTTVRGYENIVLYGRLDPKDPNEASIFEKHLFSFPFPSPTVVKIYDDIIYAGGMEHFAVYRFTEDEATPHIVWKLGGMPTLDCVLSEDVLYLANSDRGLAAYSVVNPDLPIEIGRLETYDIPRRAAIDGNELLVAAGASGVLRYDISTPEYPILRDTLGLERLKSLWDVEIYDGDIYVLGARENHMENIFIERYRTNGDWVAEYPIVRAENLDPIGEMVFGEEFVAISLGSEGIAVNRFENGAIFGDGFVIEQAGLQFCDLVIEGDVLYASDYWGGYHSFDISSMPRKVGYIKTSANGGNGIAKVGDYILAVDGPNGLAVIEWNKPAAPIHRSTFASVWGTDIAVDGDYAFMSDGQGALMVYDIANLPNAELVAELPDNGYWNHVYVHNGLLVGLDQFYGVRIYRVNREEIALAKAGKPDAPGEATIDVAYPNPFNAEITIAFELPVQTQVDLSVYDITGRKQITLVSDRLPEGKYNFRWRPDDAPSGNYFAVLTTPDNQVSRKLLFVK